MATIARVRRLGGIRYKAQIKSRGRAVMSKTFSTVTAARAWAERIERDRELIEALGTRGAAVTFAELAERYLKQWQGRDRSRRAYVGWWVERLGTRRLTNIGPGIIADCLDEYEAGRCLKSIGHGKTRALNQTRSGATVNRMRAIISALFRYAILKRLHVDNPASKVAHRPEARGRDRYASEEEISHLLTAASASSWPRLRLLITLAIGTGARAGELLGLRWCDIDLQARTATLHHTKSGKPRVLPLPEAAVRELVPFRGIGEALVFPSRHDPAKPMLYRKPWETCLKRAGVTGLVFHGLRHTAASHMAAAGADIKTIAEVLGHSQLQTSSRYTHLNIARKREVTDAALGRLLDRAGSGPA